MRTPHTLAHKGEEEEGFRLDCMCEATASQTTGHAQEPRIAPSASRSSLGAHKDRVKLTLNTDNV